MTNCPISVEKISKEYQIGASPTKGYRTLRESITGGFVSLGKQLTRTRRAMVTDGRSSGTHWALKDVSFDVQPGEVVGIIGRNGAGKSTLLKILSRITEPTSGRASIRGRIGSLLEVGTGFHPELTGRENIYMNGSILGMRRREIARKFDEIVAFSEVEEFLDTPVKRYSSGMFVRLAFAVAAHLEPEILIIDEVLAVGDAKFQKKCLSKLDDVKRGGRTVLVVSHQMQVIQAICQRSILLERGKIEKIGTTADVVATYLGSSREYTNLGRLRQSGTGEARLLELRVTTDSNPRPSEVIRGESFKVEISILVKVSIHESNFSMAIRNSDGLELFSHCWADQYLELPTLQPGVHVLSLEIPTRHLRPGPYSLSLCVAKDEADVVADVTGIELPPVVLEPTANAVVEGRRWGLVYVECHWTHRYRGAYAEIA
jgi:lipopolysaccharide transport system ATP-binding protein